MTTLEERVSFLEGAFAQLSERVAVLATRDEMLATKEELRADIRSSENALRAELRAAEPRIILWLIGAMVAVAALGVAAMKLIP